VRIIKAVFKKGSIKREDFLKIIFKSDLFAPWGLFLHPTKF